jgi:SAM-dependent methyltransferase
MTLVKEQMPMGLAYDAQSNTELRDAAAAENKSLPIHRWVPWIAGFSAQFVEDAIDAYLPGTNRQRHLILDPFAGVGTTLVEALKAGHDTIGYEVNPFAILAAAAKLKCVEVKPQDFRIELDAFRSALARFEADVDRRWLEGGEQALQEVVEDLREARPSGFRSRIPFFSPPVEAKFLYALVRTRSLLEPDRTLFRAALGATMVSFSNYSYEPSLASRPGSGKPLIENASVVMPVCRKLAEMLQDVEWARQMYGSTWLAQRHEVIEGSYFESHLRRGSVSLVVTSPPYMNNYHYVRNTRPQLYWLGLLGNGNSLHEYEQQSFGKFWQTVRQAKPVHLGFDFPNLSVAVEQLRTRNVERGYYGGPGWANYVATYFNDTYRFVKMLRSQLKHGGHAVVVIGNSIIQGMEFPVDQLFAQMAERQNLTVEEIRIVRKKRVGNSIIDSSVRNGERSGHRGKTQLYDAAVVLRR